ncbi:LutC/YkgG family protein [Elizabethkingia anophelis]|uniref:Lactate utilization protein B/C n=1 Tax=Elizabethkingia anophelis TaxID=1117645 RepID=A0A494J2Z5_9FLAO|nr:LUD domain-containing protein [Elizabethkingia anophelis]AQX52663.1 lactate utilization protein B/C [Elizabethkingia anophelis]ELB0067993.1 LUD domain-containing protein [Elizabethkingia anophelis]ELB1892688.1 LUD domain-containing protein [Elizabethkingia anophelis]MCT3639998.1 LUD domain-containing protein [Elizabethkingia anophelis]MCT4197287.1 LUD domain-containing protein [Elizabethkingia anophelis]
MGSREEILSRIAKVKPTGNKLPEDLSFIPGTGNLLESFVQTARNNGSQVTFVENTDGVLAYLRENIASDKRIISNITTLNNELKNNEEEINDPHELENVEVAIVEGSLGVAENAAIWITEKQMKYRALPFITQHLFVILAADKIVALMHDAYKIIEIEGGFSSFISGPSKTADIEQSLVIGAHGARSHHIFIMNNQ